MEHTFSFCHGQDHQADNHKHMLMICNDDDVSTRTLKQLFDRPEINRTRLETDRRIDVGYKGYEITLWILPTDFEHPSITKRLLRTTDVVLLMYSQISVEEFNTWNQTFTPVEQKTFTVIDDVNLLEKMNVITGSISTSFALQDNFDNLW